MFAPRTHKIVELMERSEADIEAMVMSRSARLSRLALISAPNFIIGNEMLMLEEALEALFRKRDYNPHEDDRIFKS